MKRYFRRHIPMRWMPGQRAWCLCFSTSTLRVSQLVKYTISCAKLNKKSLLTERCEQCRRFGTLMLLLRGRAGLKCLLRFQAVNQLLRLIAGLRSLRLTDRAEPSTIRMIHDFGSEPSNPSRLIPICLDQNRHCHINLSGSQLGRFRAQVRPPHSRFAKRRMTWFEALCTWAV